MSSWHRLWKISMLLENHKRTPFGCNITFCNTSFGLFFLFSTITWRQIMSLWWSWLFFRISNDMILKTWANLDDDVAQSGCSNEVPTHSQSDLSYQLLLVFFSVRSGCTHIPDLSNWLSPSDLPHHQQCLDNPRTCITQTLEERALSFWV